MAAKRQRDDKFYEAMPGTLDSYRFLPAEDEYTDELAGQEFHAPDEDTEDVVRQRMARQGMILFGLLVLQVILFVVLIRSTVNLG